VLESEEVSRNLGNLVAVVAETKAVLGHRPAAAVKPPDAAEPAEEDGGPFYKPHYFDRFHIGDELLRRNATDSQQYVPGKVRRRDQQTVEGKRAVYWYSEPDARRRWPDRFVGKPKSLPRS
jgi:hypothetical protein